VRDAVSPLRHGAQECDLIDPPLKRQRFVLAQRRGASDQQHRAAVEEGIGGTRYGICHARTRSHDRHTGLARRPGPPIGSVGGRLFVARVDESETVIAGRLEDGV
jgi:hypothetical protein